MQSTSGPCRLHPAALLALLTAVVLISGCAPARLDTVQSGTAAGIIDPDRPLDSAYTLSAAGQYDMALRAFSQAALDDGLTAEILAGMGAANLGAGRLGQAEPLLRRAAEAEPDWPENLNNLGIVLLERGKTAEAVQVLRRAFALDNGESDAIRDNLRLALATFEKSATVDTNGTGYKLERQGSGSYLLTSVP